MEKFNILSSSCANLSDDKDIDCTSSLLFNTAQYLLYQKKNNNSNNYNIILSSIADAIEKDIKKYKTSGKYINEANINNDINTFGNLKYIISSYINESTYEQHYVKDRLKEVEDFECYSKEIIRKYCHLCLDEDLYKYITNNHINQIPEIILIKLCILVFKRMEDNYDECKSNKEEYNKKFSNIDNNLSKITKSNLSNKYQEILCFTKNINNETNNEKKQKQEKILNDLICFLGEQYLILEKEKQSANILFKNQHFI
jgi:hypothetical protein